MEYIVYVSTAEKLMSENELLTLLRVSRARNKEHNVTGMLLYCQGTFMQVLEGEKKYIELIFKAIETDARHKNVIRLAAGELERRNFLDWPMAFASVSPQTLPEIESLLNQANNHSPRGTQHIAVTLLKTFVESNRLHI
jgi:hypothetical protein